MNKPFGVINVNKPQGWTSRDVVNRVHRLVKPAKAGHAGTLDPLATGVLLVCVGTATRLMEYAHQMPKQYLASFLLGQKSQTDDTEGEIEKLADAPIPTHEALEQALPAFLGEIQQRPPAYSAIKVNGKRAYKLARAGKLLDLPARPVQIHALRLIRYEYPELELEIECGSGTYVRSLGRDLAASLGTVAVMSALVRTEVGPFAVKDALKVSELTPESLPNFLQPATKLVAHLPQLKINQEQATELFHGRQFHAELACAVDCEVAAIGPDGELVAIVAQCESNLWKPKKVFPK